MAGVSQIVIGRARRFKLFCERFLAYDKHDDEDEARSEEVRSFRVCQWWFYCNDPDMDRKQTY
jgi:hypothetical protein